MRRAIPIMLTDVERQQLTRWATGRRTEARRVLRAKIVLMAAADQENKAIAEALSVRPNTVSRWRRRFAQRRLAGIERDAPRGGRPANPQLASRIIEATTQAKPRNATHWSTRTLARHLKVSASRVHRVWKAAGLQPHRTRTFKLSRDPNFTQKLLDIVGLYLSPPEHALVLCVDEKSQIQALDRTQPGLPMIPGRCGTYTHDYKRHGTTTLFAALELAEGRVIGTCCQRHRHQEWLKFLKLIDAQMPGDLDLHLIADNYRTHKHQKVLRWLKRHPRFHMHFTPTASSWLNLIERWFREITQKRIRRGSFRNVDQLIQAIMDYLEHYNQHPKHFVWTAQADDILRKVERARAALINVKQSETLH